MLSSGPSVPLSFDLFRARLGPTGLLLESNRGFRRGYALSLRSRLLGACRLLLRLSVVLGLALFLRRGGRGAPFLVLALLLDLLFAPPCLDFVAQRLRL